MPASTASCSIGFYQVLLLLAIGVTATAGQLLSTEAYRYVEIPTGSLLGMLVPVFNCVVGITVFRESFSIYSIAGSTMVIGSCIVVIVKNHNNSEK